MTRFIVLAACVGISAAHMTCGQSATPRPSSEPIHLSLQFNPLLHPLPSPDARVERLRWLDSADVAADFQRNAVDGHDTRFIIVRGSATYFPGAERRSQQLIGKYGARYIDASHFFQRGEDAYARLSDKAVVYAKDYNTRLLRLLGEVK